MDSLFVPQKVVYVYTNAAESEKPVTAISTVATGDDITGEYGGSQTSYDTVPGTNAVLGESSSGNQVYIFQNSTVGAIPGGSS